LKTTLGWSQRLRLLLSSREAYSVRIILIIDSLAVLANFLGGGKLTCHLQPAGISIRTHTTKSTNSQSAESILPSALDQMINIGCEFYRVHHSHLGDRTGAIYHVFGFSA
jgi:hypothetical protein